VATSVIATLSVLAVVCSTPNPYPFTPFSIGDSLIEGYGIFAQNPLNAIAAAKSGWVPSNGTYCVPGLGIPFNYGGSVPTTKYPVTFYYAVNGMFASLSVTILGDVLPGWTSAGWLTPSAVVKDAHKIEATFRCPIMFNPCNSWTSSDLVGDRLIFNPNSPQAVALPVQKKDVISWSKQTTGSCIQGMGTHYPLQVNGPTFTPSAGALFPVVPMYDLVTGNLNAIFFAATTHQQTAFGLLGGANGWDKTSLPNLLMCKNWCNSDCTFQDTEVWSTMHFWFRNSSAIAPCPCSGTVCC